FHTQHRYFSRLNDAWRADFGDEVERPHWADLVRSGVAIFDLDFDAILTAMYALSVSAEGDYYRCVPPDLGIAAAALGASESALPGTAHVEVAVGSGAARGTASGGSEPGGTEHGGVEPGGVETGGTELKGAGSGGAEPRGSKPGGSEPGGTELEGVEPEGAESGRAESWGAASSVGPTGALPRLSPRPEPLSLQQLRDWLVRRARRRSGAAGAGATGDTGAGGTGVTAGAAGPGGAFTRGTRAAGTGGVGGAGGGDPTEPGAAWAGGTCAGARGAGAGCTGTGGAGARGAGAGGTGTGGAGAGGAGAGGAGGTGAGGTVRPRPYFVPLLQQVLGVPSSPRLTPPLLYPPPDQSQLPLQQTSPLPAPSPYTEQSGGLTERREPVSRPVSPVRTALRVPRSRPPHVTGTHAMALRPSSIPLCVPLPPPPESSLPAVPDPGSDLVRAASPIVSCRLATLVTDPSLESTAAFDLVAELLDFVVACRLDYATALVAESESASPPSIGSECALGTDVLEDKQENFECLAAAVPRFASMLLAPEGDSDAPDIPTPRSYAEAFTGLYSSQWVKRPPGSPPAFKARYVARGFSLFEEIWLRCPPGFTRSFPAGTQWSLRRPVYGLRQAPRKWHDTLSTILAALGFDPSTADPSLFLRTDTALPPFYVLVYVDNLVFATADTEALTLVKSELQKRHTCTDLGTSALRLPVLLATAHSSVYQPLALSSTFTTTCSQLVGCLITSGMGLVLGGRGPVVLTGHADAPWIYAGAMAAQELRWLTYLLTDLGEQPRSPQVLYQRGQLRLAYVATRANTADIFTKALSPGDHPRFSTVLDSAIVAVLGDDLMYIIVIALGFRWRCCASAASSCSVGSSISRGVFIIIVAALAITSCEFASGVLLQDGCGGFILRHGVAVPIVGVDSVRVRPPVFTELGEVEPFVEDGIACLRDLLAEKV
ncbi:unnamed protein product, partial [Closterium sp. NIES-53]